MRTALFPVLALSVLGLAAMPARAQSVTVPTDGGTILTISATERTEVTQDLLTATLSVQMDGPDPAALQNDINALMQKAVTKAKAATKVKASTDNYHVYPYERAIDGNNGKTEKTWRGSQSLSLTGTSAPHLLTLIGQLQEMGLTMQNLSYTLSPETIETTKDSLMEAAITKLQAKAERAARALGKKKVTLVEINVDSAMPDMPVPVMMRAMAMDGAHEKMATPVAEPGTSDIALTVTARALLK